MIAVFKDVPIPGIEIVPCRLTGPKGVVKAFLLHDEVSVTLVDTGASDQDADLILDRLAKIGRPPSDLKSCIVTHRHGDHIGGLKKLRSVANFQLIAHEDEAEAIRQATGVAVDSLVRDFTRLVWFGGIEVIHSPGHTPGNIALYLPQAKALIAGDTVFSAGGHLVLPPAYLSDDFAKAGESVRRILQMGQEIDRLFVSHGEDIYEGARERVALIFVPRR